MDGSRFVGMFRAHGLLAPVWDLPVGTGPEPLEEPADRFAADLREALADSSDADRRAALRALRPREPAGHAALRPVGGGVVADHTDSPGPSVVPAPAFA